MFMSKLKDPLIFVVLIAAGVLVYALLTMRDERSFGEKIDDVVSELPESLSKAGRQLESRTPGEKLGDAIKDTGDDIKESVNKN